ncbi:MAG: hypothetical protein CMM02_14120 [Rhodopirellula sp.]|jgi:hypothetical protein|nr:hypothetical protein [Rhodopirellula sp.]
MTTTHALDYPKEDASEAAVLTYLQSKCRQLAIEAASRPDGKLKPIYLKPRRNGHPKNVKEFFTRLCKELVYFHREEMAEFAEPDTIKDFEVGDVVDGPNSYEKSLTLTFTKTAGEDDTEFDEDTKTITIKSYKTPYDDNNAGVFLKDESGYEHELCGVGIIACPGGEPLLRDDGNACPARCAQLAIQYLVWEDAPWIKPWRW